MCAMCLNWYVRLHERCLHHHHKGYGLMIPIVVFLKRWNYYYFFYSRFDINGIKQYSKIEISRNIEPLNFEWLFQSILKYIDIENIHGFSRYSEIILSPEILFTYKSRILIISIEIYTRTSLFLYFASFAYIYIFITITVEI